MIAKKFKITCTEIETENGQRKSRRKKEELR